MLAPQSFGFLQVIRMLPLSGLPQRVKELLARVLDTSLPVVAVALHRDASHTLTGIHRRAIACFVHGACNRAAFTIDTELLRLGGISQRRQRGRLEQRFPIAPNESHADRSTW
jgi:hypothetical protein